MALLVLGGTTCPPFRTAMKESCFACLAAASCGASATAASAPARTNERRTRMIIAFTSPRPWTRLRGQQDELVVHVPRERPERVRLARVEQVHAGALVDHLGEPVQLVRRLPHLARRVPAAGGDGLQR